MSRTFNVAGLNLPDLHYTLDPEPRLPDLRALIEGQNYFVIRAPRQTGKTTLFNTMARKLTQEGRYTALHFSIEGSRAFSKDATIAIANAVDSLRGTAETQLPEPLRPPEEVFASMKEPSNGIFHVLNKWAQLSRRPLVVFIDEIDAVEDEALIAILHQLRNGFQLRPAGFPQSVVLIGMRDVREYRARIRPERESMGTSSPFQHQNRITHARQFQPCRGRGALSSAHGRDRTDLGCGSSGARV